MQETLRWLDSLKQVRYQLIAHDFIGHLLLDVGLNEMALEHLDRGLALGRDTGVMFWRAAIDAHVAVARSRLGHQDVAAQLQETLEQARSNSERYLMVRCTDALAEISLAAGDSRRCRAHADELLAIAQANGLRELEASARRWRGEAWLAEKAYEQAHTELSRASALAKDIGRVRLQMDAEDALARLLRAQARSDDAQHHAVKARAIAEAIAKSLVSSELEGRLKLMHAPL